MIEKRNLLLLSIKDFFTAEMLKLTFLPYVTAIIIIYVILLSLADMTTDYLQHMQVHVEQSQSVVIDGTTHTEQMSGSFEGPAILQYIIEYLLTSSFVSILVYVVLMIIGLPLSIVFAMIIIGFLTPPILKVIQKRHYPDVELVGYGHLGTIIWQFVKSLFVMIGLFILLIPLYFIPVINLIAFNIPLYYFFHKLLTFDVASTIMTKEEYARIKLFNSNVIRFKTLMLYLISLIPFAVLFVTAFFVIYLGHTFLSEVKKLRSSDGEIIEAIATEAIASRGSK